MKTKEEIEQSAENYLNINLPKNGYNGYIESYIKGYTQCQEDMADKKYTKKDIRKAIQFGQIMEQLHEYVPISDFINSLNKQD